MIDLTATAEILKECTRLVRALNGQDLNETDALTSQSKGQARQRKARMSQDLQLLASRFELAAQLVRNEYWFARGEMDPCNPDRTPSSAAGGSSATTPQFSADPHNH